MLFILCSRTEFDRKKSKWLRSDYSSIAGKHSPGANGTIHVFAAIADGKVMAWLTYTRWSGATYVRMLRALRRNILRRWPTRLQCILCHDQDPTGFLSKKGKRAEAHLGFDPLVLSVRSPELMPLDYSFWHAVLAKMQATENARPAGWKESVPDYKTRLHNTAKSLTAAYVNSILGQMPARCAKLVASNGGHIEESGTKRTGER